MTPASAPAAKLSTGLFRGFIVGRYLAGQRGRALVAAVPAAWVEHPGWGQAKRLAAAIAAKVNVSNADAEPFKRC